MPIFDYRCDACGYSFDVLQKLGADALRDCPDCGEAELKKLMSAPAFHLKGKGWRNSDDTPKKPHIAPKFGHTFDSATPHAEHNHDEPAKKKPKQGGASGHSHDSNHGHGHGGHSHAQDSGHSHGGGHSHGDHGHSHASPAKKSESKKDKESSSKSHDHGHSHGGGHTHKHD